MIDCKILHIKDVSKSATLITLCKLKTSKINISKIEDACTDMPLIDSFLFTAEITVPSVANRQWNTLKIVCSGASTSRLWQTCQDQC